MYQAIPLNGTRKKENNMLPNGNQPNPNPLQHGGRTIPNDPCLKLPSMPKGK